MRIHSLQHVPFEDIGSMTSDLLDLGHSLSTTHWYNGDAAPGLDEFDALIVMGGPMGVYDVEQYPWLAAEKNLIGDAIAAGKIILGICLGAQLIADIMGANVSRNPHKEIGWFPLTITPDASHHPIAQILASHTEVFHWHGDTFALPNGAIHLASSAACDNQAFCVDDRILGFQFHLETTPTSARALLEHCPEDVDGSIYTQTAQEMMRDEKRFAQINQAMSKVVHYLFAPT